MKEDADFAKRLQRIPTFVDFEGFLKLNPDAEETIDEIRKFYKEYGTFKFDELIRGGTIKVKRDENN